MLCYGAAHYWANAYYKVADNRISGCFSSNIAMVSEQRPTKVSKYCTLVGLFLMISQDEVKFCL